MSLFNSKNKRIIKALLVKNQRLARENEIKDCKIKELTECVERLIARSNVKDECFKEVISDALRCGSPVAARYMVDRREYLRGKR